MVHFGTLEVTLGIISLFLAIYYYLVSNYNFWKSRGVPGPKPVPVFGTTKDILFGKYSVGSYLKAVCDEYPDEPMVGIYTRREPILVLNDLDLIKLVLIKDFKSFMDRGVDIFEKLNPLTAHLFNLEPRRWRPLRTKLTPVFTSGKLKEMFYLLIQCADQLENYLKTIEKNDSVDIREICAKFMTDVIGVCAFGLQANALADENSIFRTMGKKLFQINFRKVLEFRLRSFAPILYKFIGHWFIDNEVTNFFINLTRDTMDYRRTNNIFRHDFIDLMKKLKDDPSQLDDIEMNDGFVAAQLFVFFIAGFETSSSTMSNCLFELAMNHAIQDRLRDEINQELKKTSGNITYDGIKNMKYLDKVVKETLRKYPPLTFLMRRTTRSYTFPNTQISIPEGTKVWIPIFAIQRDAKFYPEPDVFNPERFDDETIESLPEMAFLPFGDGPRNCIGARFGSMQTKVGLIKILQNHSVDVCEETDRNYEINPRYFFLTPKNGIFLKVIKRNEMSDINK